MLKEICVFLKKSVNHSFASCFNSSCLQVFQPRTQSAPAEAGPVGVVDGPKSPEAGLNLEGKHVGGSPQPGAQQLWPEPWLEQQPLQLQLMLLMATVSPKVSKC